MIATSFLAMPESLPQPRQRDAGIVSVSGIGMPCPTCSQPSVVKEGAFLTCRNCGWSKCS